MERCLAVVRRVLLAMSLASLLAACGEKSEAEVLAGAQAALAKRDFNSATVQLKDFLQRSPQAGEARLLLARALFESGDVAGAKAEFDRAIEARVSEEAAAPVGAKILLASRQFHQLIERYKSVEVADFQAAVDLKLALAAAHAAQGQLDDARAAVARALSIKPDSAEAQIANARLVAADGKYDNALQILDTLLAKTPTAAQAWLFKGDLLAHAKNDPQAAMAAYRKAIDGKPDLADGHAGVIALAFAAKDLAAVSSQIEAMKKVLPQHPLTRYFEAQLAFSKADYARARELLQPMARSLPNHVGILHLAGATEYRLGAMVQAETMLAKVVQLAPGFAAARRTLAQVYLQQRQPSKAQSVLKPILETDMADAESMSLMAQASAMLGETKTADEYFTKASRIKPDDKRIRTAQALNQIASGNAEVALTQLESMAAADQGTAVDMALISAHLRRNEIDKALKAIDAFEKKQPDSPVSANLRGRALLAKKDPAGARKAFEQAIARDPKFVAAAGALAALDLMDKQPDAARGRFEAVLKADPKSARAMVALGELAMRAGSAEQATKSFNDAVAADPADAAVRAALIDHHLRQRDPKAALVAAQAAVNAMPNQPELIEKQARTQMVAGEVQQAAQTFSKLTQLRPDYVPGFIGLAESQLQLDQLDVASRSIRRALELAPASPQATSVAMAIAMKQKRPAEALGLARQLQARFPNEAAGFLAEGEIEAESKNVDSAVAAFRKATTKATPGRAPARLHQTLVAARRDAEAAKFAESWLAAHPQDAMFQFHLGDMALAAKDFALAEKRYGEVLKVSPDNVLAMNNIAWLMVQGKRAGAVALAEKAVAAAPNQPALMDTLALALAAESQLPKALAVQKKVVELAPEAAGYRLALARLYLQSGDKVGARIELERLAKLGNKFNGQSEVSELLKAAGS